VEGGLGTGSGRADSKVETDEESKSEDLDDEVEDEDRDLYTLLGLGFVKGGNEESEERDLMLI